MGHDEPSLLYYSNRAGSGNQMQYKGVIPKEPPATPIPGRSYSFMNYIAFWYGLAMCDTQSYPQTVKTCIPDSDANITKAGSPYHPGAAFTELQFYPPGYVQQFNGSSCSATKWCVALNIDSLSLNPVTGKQLNTACENKILGGEEYINYAYLTHSGKPQGPPNPVQFDPVASGKPDLGKVLTLNQGDSYSVTMHDTAHGLQTTVSDTTTGESGTMTASAANGFGQVKAAPAANGGCTLLPYDFHPMYSTSSPADHRAMGGGHVQRRHRYRDRPLRLLQACDRLRGRLRRYRRRRRQRGAHRRRRRRVLQRLGVDPGARQRVRRHEHRLRRHLLPAGLAER